MTKVKTKSRRKIVRDGILPLSHKYMINSRASGRQWLRCHWTNPIKRRAKR